VEINFFSEALRQRLPLSTSAGRAHLSFLLSNFAILLALPILPHIPHICLARTLLGIPCPGCGITHSVLAVGQFKFAAAWQSNPSGLALALGFLFQLTARPVALLFPATGESISRVSRTISGCVVAFVFAVWILRLI